MNKEWSGKLKEAHADFMLWFHGKLDRPPKNPFLPSEIEEGGLVEPYMPEGVDQEIVLFDLGGKDDRHSST